MQLRKSPLFTILFASLALLNLPAATPVWDTNATAGIQAGNGTWDFNTTSNWTLDGGVTRGPWNSNTDTANFQLQTGQSSGTVTIDNTVGQVGAVGLLFSGTMANSQTWTVGGDALQLGSGGLTANITNDTDALVIAAPIALTSSQVWSSRIGRAVSSGSAVNITGALSSLSGTTNLTFDGENRYNSVNVGSNARASFTMSGANTYSGTTTVTGGGLLLLNYVTGNTSRLDDSSALILNGGTISLNGNAGSDYVETVASTTINAGHNDIIAGSANGGGGVINHIALGNLTHNVGGTLDVSAAVTDLARTTTSLTNNIIGGWATVGGNRFATTTGTVMGTLTGTTSSTYSAWTATSNIAVNGAAIGTTNQTVNSLRFAATGSITLSGGQTLTVASGGIIGDTGTGMSGGNLTSGLASGELFVHTPSALAISSAIVDNGATKTVLVKSGANTLTLSGANTYTGATYINAGTLLVSGSSTLQGTVIQAGGSTVTVGSTGTLSPGAAGTVGLMSLGGNLTLNDGAVVSLQLGTTSDLVSLTNAFSTLTGSASAGGITLNLSNAGGLGASTYSLFQWASGTTLSGFDLTDFNVVTAGGFTGTLQFGANSLDYVVTAVPEPSTVALALGGLGFLVLLRRRRMVGVR